MCSRKSEIHRLTPFLLAQRITLLPKLHFLPSLRKKFRLGFRLIMAKRNSKPTAPPRFESILWQAADKLRGNLDAAEYKHVVLGLIFLKYVSDAFEEKHAKLAKETGEGTGVSQQFMTVGDEKSPNNNADRNYRTADWVEITRTLRRCNHPFPVFLRKSAGALETQAHTAVDAVHGVIFAGEFTGVIGEDRHI